MSATCDLSIIIVTWNVWDLLRACLLSIERCSRPVPGGHGESQGGKDGGSLREFGPPDRPHRLEVIVVDNASSDATAELLPARFPWVRLIANPENLGFTRGNNRGYACSRGRFVYFLNPDTELLCSGLAGDGLWQLFQAVAANETVGLAGPRLHYADNSFQNNRRRFPTPLTGFFESTWLGRLWPGNPWVRRMHMADWPPTFSHDVDWVTGAAMLARREALEAIRPPDAAGPFDEGFFMYSEELDLCHRLKRQGWRVIYVPQARVIHYEGRSSEQVVAARHIHFNASKVRYYRKYFGPVWAELLRRYLLWEFRWQLMLEGLKFILGHRRPLRQARMAAYRQVLASGLRPSPVETSPG
ncbi:MAG: glycosyl transferase [Litorilinea sp.]|nr:MAG: glycosyl transferase [Litorilinea sp.]